ncbi:MAG: GNAT family N-acyltransferase, partial [Bacteroidia bacterium]
METTLKYSVSIMTNPEQLTEALSLRYRTYKKVYPKITETLTQPYETDGFDTRSIHLGLYAERGGKKILAGYSRLIIPPVYENKYTD